MPSKLKNLVITKVALVDEGSCSAAHIKLYKKKEGGNTMKTLEQILKSLPADEMAVVEAEIAKAKQFLPEGALSPEDKKKLEDAKNQADIEKKAALDDVEAMKKAKNAGEASDEELLKNVEPAVRALIEKTRSQAVAAETAIKKMKEESDNKEALAKAKELPNIGAKAEDLAKSFKDLKNFDPALFENIFGVMKAANELIASGDPFTEIGKNANADDESLAKAADAAWAEIEKKADEIKKTANCTKEQAISKAIQANGALYQKYLDNLK